MFKEGVYTVLVTPFNKEGIISYNSLDNLVNNQINKGVKGIITMGTTSESPTINYGEKVELIKYLWNKYNESINIIIGIGGNNTQEVIDFGRFCSDYCHAYMVTAPHYNKPSQEGIYTHFNTIANADIIKEKDIMMYNIPSRCGVNMDPEIISKLYNTCPNIVAIKEASGSISQTQEILNLCDINIFSGDDALVVPLMSCGAKGVISVTSNLIPNYMVRIVNNCLNNNFNEAMQLNSKIHTLLKLLFIETNPVPLKYLLNRLEIIEEATVRLPLVKINKTNISLKLNQKIGLINELNRI